MSNDNKLSKLKEENARLLRVNQKLKNRVKNLESKDEIEFINDISHEMRIPAQAINAISKGLVQNWHNFDMNTNFELAKKIAGNAGRLASFIENIIEIPNIKRGMVRLRFAKVLIIDLIKEVIEDCKNFYITGKNLKFKLVTNIAPDTKILIDASKIALVLRNILANSIKASDNGNIIIDASIKDSEIIVHVIDPGTGIKKNILDNLFKDSTKSLNIKSDIPGTGIGLRIASEIIKAHNGTIQAANNIGKGAKISFFIPIPSTTNTKNKAAHIESITSDNLNVVAIDDEDAALLSISMMLMKTGYNLKLFSSPIEALKQIKANPTDVDIILLDIMMPEMNGLDLLKELRANASLKNISVIVQSGVADMSQIDEALSLGAKDFIRKPFSKEILITAIENISQQKK